jgi:vacuolar-type H+-ATPase subunit F/Vma7
MSHRVAVVGDSGATLGFRLAGFRPHVVDSEEAAASLLAQLTREPVWGVILVQEDLMPGLAPATRRSSAGLPILVPFPAPARERPPGEAEAYVAELLRQAVGYRVRLR